MSRDGSTRMGSIRETMEDRFRRFREDAGAFSRDMVLDLRLTRDPAKTAELNVKVTRAVFGKWSIEILVTLYSLKSAGFEHLRKALGPISSGVLSGKLRALEDQRLILRTIMDSRPPRAQYSLTERGLTVARLGEPVLLYLRYVEGLL